MLIRTVLGEAANQSDTGQEAVAEVVLNRLKSGRYGKSLQDVMLAPKQFEPWQTRRNELMAISPDSTAYQRTAMLVDKVLRGEIDDPTRGATHFANVDTVRGRGNSSALAWIDDMRRNGSAVQIGDHLFGSPSSQPGGGTIDPRVLEGERRQAEVVAAARQALLPYKNFIPNFDARLGPAPSAVASSAPIINHDTDINIFGNADKTAQTAIVNAQYDIYAQAVRNNLPRTR
jgi:hypothetical protein